MRYALSETEWTIIQPILPSRSTATTGIVIQIGAGRLHIDVPGITQTRNSSQLMNQIRRCRQDLVAGRQSVIGEEIVDTAACLQDNCEAACGVPGIDVSLPVAIETTRCCISEPERA